MNIERFTNNILIDKSKKWGAIRFIHTDDKEHCFWSCVNDMTGDRLSAFDNDAPSLNDSIAWIRSVFRDIEIKANPLEKIGNIY